MSSFRVETIAGGVRRITFDQANSRVNTLNQGVQTELEAILADLQRDANLPGVVLCSGKPGIFIAGADLKELAAAPPSSDQARVLTLRGLAIIAGFERLPCPTVALIDGGCMGGGLELALGFDYRLAGTHPKTEIGLPETKIGLIPGWGGTQRLPRLIGPSLACELICPGEAVKGPKARELGIVFDVVPSDQLEAEALQLIAWSKQSGDWQKIRERKQLPVGLSEQQHGFTFAVARAQVLAKTRGHFPAPVAAIDAIAQGCNLPLEDGLKKETDAFLPLIGSEISRNLIALFFANQRIQKDTGVADASVQPRELKSAGVLGAGLMGSGIAGAHVRRGIPMVMIDVTPAALRKGVDSITKVCQSRIEIGKMSAKEMLDSLALLTSTTQRQQLSECDLVIEAIVENESAKTQLYRELLPILKSDTILASNTSTISITRMANAWHRPDQFAGLHFFNPVDRMQLVEVIRGEKTSDATIATLVAHAKKLGKSPIVVKDCPGFLVNRILFPYMNEALALLEEGADPRALDKAAEAFGMPMGPITLSDLVGLDTALFAGKVVADAFPERACPNRILGALVAAGRLGKKTGAGFYNYAKSSRGTDDPVFAKMLDECRRDRRSFSQEDLTDRLFLPMLVEAAIVLQEGVVRDPLDVDMGLLLGIGFPQHRGGLLRWAENTGLDVLRGKLDRLHSLGKRFEAPPLLRATKRFFS